MNVPLLRWLSYGTLALIASAIVPVIAGQMGLLRGRMPTDLGVRDGRLKPPSLAPNSVSSQAHLHDPARYQVDYARIDPIRFAGDGAAALARLRKSIEQMPGASVVQSGPDYLYVQFSTRWLGFVDDAEFWLSPAEGVIHTRSASRIGRNDLGCNRARIDAIRARFAAPG